jgi:hypothetical protein
MDPPHWLIYVRLRGDRLRPGKAEVVTPFLRVGSHPEPRQVTRHRLSVMRNQNSTRFRGDADYPGVGQTDDTAIMSTEEIDGWVPIKSPRSSTR